MCEIPSRLALVLTQYFQVFCSLPPDFANRCVKILKLRSVLFVLHPLAL